MAAPSKTSLLKKARYLIPFIKPLSLGLVDPENETVKDLASAGLDLLGAEAREKIKDLLAKEPDAATGLLDEHLVRHTGEVLAQLVRHYAKDPARANQRNDYLELAGVIPGAWARFIESGTGKMKALREDAFLDRLATALDPQSAEPALDSAAFVEFFRWTAVEKDVLGPLKPGLTPPLAKWIEQHLDTALFTELCKDTPAASAAFREVVLRYHAKAQGKLDVLQSVLQQHGQKLDELLEGQKDQATKQDIRELRQSFERTSPLGIYLERIQEEYHFIEVITLDTADDPNVREAMAERGIVLQEAYVEPPCSGDYQHPEDFDASVLAGKEKCEPLMARLARHQRIVLLADPGMGKSTLIRSLMHSLASGRPPAAAAGTLSHSVPFPLILRDLVPMLLERRPDPARWRWADLLDVLECWCPGNAPRPLLESFTGSIKHRAKLKDLYQSPLAFFLVDGLDEVGSADLRRHMQRVLWEAFQLMPRARFLITSRVVGYNSAPVHEEGINSLRSDNPLGRVKLAITNKEARSFFAYPHAVLLHLTPFADQHQRQFAQYWFGQRFGKGTAHGSTEDFLRAAREHDSVGVIGRNPYILLLLVFVYQDQQKLPDGRTKIYDRVADLYLKVLDYKARVCARLGPIARCSADQKKRWLQLIAMHMQMRRTQAAKAEKNTRQNSRRETHSATVADLARWLEGQIDCDGYESEADAAHAFAEYLGERTGLLVPRGQDHFEWQHNSFMEFFAALYIHDQLKTADEISKWGLDPEAPRAELEAAGYPPDSLPAPLPARHAELAQWAADERWREVILFLLEYLAGPGKTAEILRHLRGIFPTLHSAQLVEPDNEKPLMPLEAVDLLVRIAHDSHLDLPPKIRHTWWQRLWGAYLDWPHPPFTHPQHRRWPIAPVLLERQELRAEVLQALAAEQPRQPGKPLYLCDCAHLISADLQHLSGLESLRVLDLTRCTGLRDTAALAGLSQLQWLNLSDCTGVKGAEAWQGLAQLESLRELFLSGCTGLEDTATLRRLCDLIWLDLTDCKALDGVRAWLGVAELVSLRVLVLSSCTGLRDTSILAELHQLEAINLSFCTGLEDAAAWQGLAGRHKLWQLNLMGCNGLRDTAALAGLRQLEMLDLAFCTGLEGVGAIQGLAGLEKLRQLDLSGCTGLDAEAVREVRRMIRSECEIIGPDGKYVKP